MPSVPTFRKLGFQVTNNVAKRLNVNCNLTFYFHGLSKNDHTLDGYWELAEVLKDRGINVVTTASGDRLVYPHDIQVRRYVVVADSEHAELVGRREGWIMINTIAAIGLVKYSECQALTIEYCGKASRILPLEPDAWDMVLTTSEELDQSWIHFSQKFAVAPPAVKVIHTDTTAADVRGRLKDIERARHDHMSIDKTHETTIDYTTTIGVPSAPSTVTPIEPETKRGRRLAEGEGGNEDVGPIRRQMALDHHARARRGQQLAGNQRRVN